MIVLLDCQYKEMSFIVFSLEPDQHTVYWWGQRCLLLSVHVEKKPFLEKKMSVIGVEVQYVSGSTASQEQC